MMMVPIHTAAVNQFESQHACVQSKQSIYNADLTAVACSHLNPVHPGNTQGLALQARAGVAQLVERKALNLVVKGSSPFFGD